MANALDGFANTFDVRKEQLEDHIGAPFARWRGHDLTKLIVLYESLKRGEVTKDQVFGGAGVSDDEVTAQAAAAPAPDPAAGPAAPLSARTYNALDTLFADLRVGRQRQPGPPPDRRPGSWPRRRSACPSRWPRPGGTP